MEWLSAWSGWVGRRWIAGLLGLVLGVVPAFACGPKRDLKAEVEQLATQWRMAQLAGDTAAMDRMLADDYVGMTMQGQVTTKAQQLRRMADRRIILRKLDLSDIRVRLVGAVAVVTMRARVVGEGATGAVNGHFRCRQIFRQLPDGRWSMTNFEVDPSGHRERGQVRAG